MRFSSTKRIHVELRNKFSEFERVTLQYIFMLYLYVLYISKVYVCMNLRFMVFTFSSFFDNHLLWNQVKSKSIHWTNHSKKESQTIFILIATCEKITMDSSCWSDKTRIKNKKTINIAIRDRTFFKKNVVIYLIAETLSFQQGAVYKPRGQMGGGCSNDHNNW